MIPHDADRPANARFTSGFGRPEAVGHTLKTVGETPPLRGTRRG
jgi:hypothetical protein